MTLLRVNLALNPYLFGCLILLAFWCVTLTVVYLRGSRANRQEFWWSSIVCSLLGFTEPLFVPEYWDPPSILAYGRWDIESFVFCFAIGGISAVAPEWRPLRKTFLAIDQGIWNVVRWVLTPFRLLTGMDASPVDELILTREEIRRENAILLAIFLGSFGFMAHAGLNVIYDAAVASAAMGVYVSWRRPRLRWQVWSGALMFLAIYTVVLVVVGLRYPTFYIDHWNLPALSGLFFLDAPIEEYLFAATLGAFWAPLYEAWRNERASLKRTDIALKARGATA